MVPSSSEGAACTGGADCVGGVMTKGNSGSGAAAAEPENAMPMASALRATAARREFSLSVFRLNICRPLFLRLAPVRRVVGQMIRGQRFQDVCVVRANWFRRRNELFRRDVAGTPSPAGGGVIFPRWQGRREAKFPMIIEVYRARMRGRSGA